MSKTSSRPFSETWMVDSPLALESYLEAVESEQERISILEGVLAQMRQRLDLAPREEATPSVNEIRAMFAQYQSSSTAPPKPISELVSDMREE
jgi:hypothetical protein